MSVESWIACETQIAGALFVMWSCYTEHDPLLSELIGVSIQGVSLDVMIACSELLSVFLNLVTVCLTLLLIPPLYASSDI